MEKTIRCEWCGQDPLYTDYHDNEWGKLTTDDKQLFEFLLLEGAQAGLSWITILRKRDGYRKAFANFEVQKVALFDENDIERLYNDDHIVRNKRKILSAISNAKLFIEIQKEYGSFHNYILSFFPDNKPIVNNLEKITDIPVSNSISDAISKDMKARGFKFFGTVICYSFLQATGFINDHIDSCFAK